MEYLVVDGYNVIGCWPELKELKQHALADARQQLAEVLMEYQAFTGLYIILVFDAYRSKGIKTTEYFSGMEIRYTEHGQTADSLIEKLVSKLAAENKVVGVVTSDWAQQQIVLGKGARRWSSHEFYLETRRISSQISDAARRTGADRPATELKSRLGLRSWKALQNMADKDKRS